MLEPFSLWPHLRRTRIAFVLAAATLLSGQRISIAVKDVVYDSKGQPFTGSVVITATNASDPNVLSQMTVPVDDGMLSVVLNEPPLSGRLYNVQFRNNDRRLSWDETWLIRPSDHSLSLKDIRYTGDSIDSGKLNAAGATFESKDISLPLPISDVSGLNAALSQISNSLSTLGTTISTLTAKVQGVQALSIVNGEVPLGPINGVNTTFIVSAVPVPNTLQLFKNGQRQLVGTDYQLAGASISFSKAAPQNGDTLLADYEKTNSQSGLAPVRSITLPIPISGVSGLSQALNQINTSVTTLTSNVSSLSAGVQSILSVTRVTGETPTGPINGTNCIFALAKSPTSASTVILFKNGIRLVQSIDYSIQGSIITFVTNATPTNGDVLNADYTVIGP